MIPAACDAQVKRMRERHTDTRLVHARRAFLTAWRHWLIARRPSIEDTDADAKATASAMRQIAALLDRQ